MLGNHPRRNSPAGLERHGIWNTWNLSCPHGEDIGKGTCLLPPAAGKLGLSPPAVPSRRPAMREPNGRAHGTAMAEPIQAPLKEKSPSPCDLWRPHSANV